MAKRSRKGVEYEQIVKGVVANDAIAWVKELLEQNNSKYSRVNLCDEGVAVVLDQMRFPETCDEDDADWDKYSVWLSGYHYSVIVDIWCGCPLQVHTVYVYGDINCYGKIERSMILDVQMNRLVWRSRGLDENHRAIKVWHGVEDFRFWEIPPYVEESGVKNEDLLDMNEPCWSW